MHHNNRKHSRGYPHPPKQKNTTEEYIIFIIYPPLKYSNKDFLPPCIVFIKKKQYNTNTSPRTQIIETQNNHQTISENTNIGSKTINSPSLCTKLPLSTRRTQVIVLPIINSSLLSNKIASVMPKNLPSPSPSLSDRMELDIHPVRGGSTQSSPTVYK